VEKDCHSYEFSVNLDVTGGLSNACRGFRYQLEAVVAHLGIAGNGLGDYLTFCRILDQWICFNDCQVECIGQQQSVQEHFPETEASTQTASRLLYVAEQQSSASI
jgi:ubiquitin C-terminal hydrolase